MSWKTVPEWCLDVTKAIMETVRLKDQATYWHCVRVSRGARLLAQAAGLDEWEQKTVEFAGLFHDIGKVGVPESILNKPGKLNHQEFEIMKSHPELSVQILQPLRGIEFFNRLIPGVLYHHERVDGKGYPGCLYGENIPLESRLILVVDTFDAMTADRVYRKGLPKEVAYQELKDFAGQQFDHRLVEIFLQSHPEWSKKDKTIFDEMNETLMSKDQEAA